MARTAAGATLSALHREDQLALRAKVLRAVMRLFPIWDPSDPASYRRFEEALVILTRAGYDDSAFIAQRFYEQFRAVEMPSAVAVAGGLAVELPEEQIRAAISATSRAAVFRALKSGQKYEKAMANGLVEVSGSVSRLALKGGRDFIEGQVRRDPLALGYSRVTSGEPCAFCSMLASRGPVYKEDTAYFRAHDHCSCTAEPCYPGSEWPGRAREFRRLWNESGSLNTFRSNLGKQRAAAATATAETT